MNRYPAYVLGSIASLLLAVTAAAASLQTQHNEVADGAITIAPADRADWDGINPFTPLDVDPDSPVLSIETVSIAHDSTKTYFRMAMDAFDVNDPNQSFFGVFHSIYIDADQDRGTGYIGDDGDPNLTDGVLSIGADYLIQGPYLYRFGNLANPGGANQEMWGWGGIIPGNMIYDDDPVSDIEFEINRAQIGNPDAFDFFAITETPAFETQDVFPNSGNAVGGDFFTYSFLPVAGGIDGDYNDSGLVEQGDLDQVLANWGAGFASIPGTWINQRPTEGIVDQAELDVVLTEWGSSSAPSFAGSAVPEPASAVLLSLATLGLTTRRRRA